MFLKLLNNNASSSSNSKFRNTASTCILTKEFHSRIFLKNLNSFENSYSYISIEFQCSVSVHHLVFH